MLELLWKVLFLLMAAILFYGGAPSANRRQQ